MDIQEFRLAVLSRIISGLQDAGKIQLQKLIYFLQEAFGLPTEYVFRMHHYGPYSEDLDTDMTRLKVTGYVSIDPDLDGYGFHVKPVDVPDQNWESLVAPYGKQINQVLKLFGDRPASELELAATIHFVDHLLKEASHEQVIETVISLKPKFNRAYITSCQTELREQGLLK